LSERKVRLGYAVAMAILTLLIGVTATYSWLRLMPVPEKPKEEPVLPVVRIGWLGGFSLQMPLIARVKGFDEEFGFRFEMVPFARAADAMQALLTGDVNVTYSAFLQAESAYLKGAYVKGIIAALYGGDKWAIVTLNTTGIKEAKDLAGKTVAIPGFGATPELFILLAAEMSGISSDSINLVQQDQANIMTSLSTGTIDAGVIPDPTLTAYMKREPKAMVIMRGTNIPVINYAATGAYYVQQDLLVSNNSLAYNIYLALAKAQWYIRTTGPDSDEILSVLSNETGIPVPILRPSASKNIWDPRLKPCQVVNIRAEQEFFVDKGSLDHTVPLSEIWCYGLYERARIEHPEFFADLDSYLLHLKEVGIVADQDFIVDFGEYLESQT